MDTQTIETGAITRMAPRRPFVKGMGHLALGAGVGDTIIVRPSGDPQMTVTVISITADRVNLEFCAARSIQILRERLARKLPPGAKLLSSRPAAVSSRRAASA